jgi:beta-carotene 3-hydroxylase
MFYGLCYFNSRCPIHQRFKFKTQNKYLIGRKAHKAHHKHLGKEHGECLDATCTLQIKI